MSFRGPINLSAFYRVTWQLMILLCGILAVVSGVVRAYVTIPFFLISFFLVTPYGGNLGESRRKLRFSLGSVLGLLTVNQVMRFNKFEDLVEVMIEMVCGFLPLVLLNHDRTRSYWLAVLTTSVISIGCISFTSSGVVYIAFIAFIVLLLLNLNAANLYLPDQSGMRLRDSLPQKYFRQFVYVLPAGFISAGFIFLAFPRVQSFTMSLGNMMGQSRTGYSGAIELSGSGEIETSQALALMVETRDKDWLRAKGPMLMFRGDSLDTFDGFRWSSTVFEFKPLGRAQDLRVAMRHGQHPVDVVIHREPSPSSAIFYPGVLINVLSRDQNAGEFLFNRNGSMIRDTFGLERYSYHLRIASPLSVSSMIGESLQDLVRATRASSEKQLFPYEISSREIELYTTVLPAVKDASWFKAWVEEVQISPADMSLSQAVQTINRHFETKFKASLDNKFSGDNSFESFLTKERSGHCEFFSTAAALLFRSLGIPTRVAVGYRGGVYNDLIDVLEVREESAHAWVEVFAPDTGWLTIDPTPSAPVGLASDVGSQIRIYVNAISYWFRQYVVDYDQSAQRELVRSLTSLGKRGPFDARALKAILTDYAKPLLVAVFFIAIVGLSLWKRRGQISRGVIPEYYRRFDAKMRRAGFGRGIGETYERYHARLVARGVEASLVTRLDVALARDLYARVGTGEEERTSLLRSVRELKVSA